MMSIFKEKRVLYYKEVKMIFEISFVMVGGINFGLEKSWGVVEELLKKYPYATWTKIVNWKRGKGKYIIEINE